jgi:hypothetical protein
MMRLREARRYALPHSDGRNSQEDAQMLFTMSKALNAFTRNAASATSRRASLRSLGGAALAANAATRDVSGAKKKSGDKCKKKEKQRCSNDAAACKNTVALGCDPMDPTNCAAEKECCDTCSANAFITCLLLISRE